MRLAVAQRPDRHGPRRAPAGGDGPPGAGGPARWRGVRLPPPRRTLPRLRHRDQPRRLSRPQPLLVPHLPAQLTPPPLAPPPRPLAPILQFLLSTWVDMCLRSGQKVQDRGAGSGRTRRSWTCGAWFEVLRVLCHPPQLHDRRGGTCGRTGVAVDVVALTWVERGHASGAVERRRCRASVGVEQPADHVDLLREDAVVGDAPGQRVPDRPTPDAFPVEPQLGAEPVQPVSDGGR